MRVGILFSGGKDSNFVSYLAKFYLKPVCLMSVLTKNFDSYMFQKSEREFLLSQSEAMNIPIIFKESSGLKEVELKDLYSIILRAKEEFKIEAVLSGAIQSVYQSLRIERICRSLDLFCINPLWQINEEAYFKNLIERGFQIKIVKIASYPFDESILGAEFNQTLLNKFKLFKKEFGVSLIGEGGEFETLVLDSPIYERKLSLKYSKSDIYNFSGSLRVESISSINKSILNNNYGSPFLESLDLYYSKLEDINSNSILIIDLNDPINYFGKYEFVRPIIDILNEVDSVEIRKNIRVVSLSQLAKMESSFLESFFNVPKKIILSGVSLKDFFYEKHMSIFKFLLKRDKLVLGICAGAQILSSIFGVENEFLSSIELKDGFLVSSSDHIFSINSVSHRRFLKSLYVLHNKRPNFISLKEISDFVPLICDVDGYPYFFRLGSSFYCSVFHPEVRLKWLIQNFVLL